MSSFSIDWRFTVFIFIVVCSCSCKKERTVSQTITPPIIIQNVELQFSFLINDKAIVPNKLIYENSLNKYGVDSLKLLIGSLVFTDKQHIPFLVDNYHLVDINDESTWKFSNIKLNNLGKIESLKLCLGLRTYNNQVYKNLDTAQMKFPSKIYGKKVGGYYACKFRGPFIDDGGHTDYYALNFTNKFKEEDSTYTDFTVCGIINITEFELYETSNLLKISIHVDDFFGNEDKGIPEIDLNNLNGGLEFKGDETKKFAENVVSSIELSSVSHP